MSLFKSEWFKVLMVPIWVHSWLLLFQRCLLSALWKEWWNGVAGLNPARVSLSGKPIRHPPELWNDVWSQCGINPGFGRAFLQLVVCRTNIHLIQTSEYQKRQDWIWQEDGMKWRVWKRPIEKCLISDFSFSLNFTTNFQLMDLMY